VLKIDIMYVSDSYWRRCECPVNLKCASSSLLLTLSFVCICMIFL